MSVVGRTENMYRTGINLKHYFETLFWTIRLGRYNIIYFVPQTYAVRHTYLCNIYTVLSSAVLSCVVRPLHSREITFFSCSSGLLELPQLSGTADSSPLCPTIPAPAIKTRFQQKLLTINNYSDYRQRLEGGEGETLFGLQQKYNKMQ